MSDRLYVFLFDTINGGPATAVQCKAFIHNTCLEPADKVPCNKVIRTKRGMIMHLERVHGIKIQMEMFMKTGCRVVGCDSPDDNGVVEIGDLRFAVCRKHITQINGEDQIGLVKRPKLTIHSSGELKGQLEITPQ